MLRGKSQNETSTNADISELRRRHHEKKVDSNIERSTEHACSDEVVEDKKQSATFTLDTGTYWLTRVVILRYLAFVYFVAFLVALNQNQALIGKDGLLPADKYLNNIKSHVRDNNWDKFKYAPTLLWLVDYQNHIDWWLSFIAIAGLCVSGSVLIFGLANIPLMLLLWSLYHSINSVGQRWYSFGWESQLLETGFLAAFLCPLLSLRRLPKGTPTSLVVLFGFRWLIFRIMLGAGLIKIRGDQCWRDLTCMNYHYETQPVPNPISYYMHQEPEVFHKFETLSNHFVELVAPFMIFLTRRLRIAGGIIQILFQVILIISGNLSFLNWLTITPSLACFDDASLSWIFSSARGSTKWQVWKLQQMDKYYKLKLKWHNHIRRSLNFTLGLLLVYLSIPIIQNLLSSRQIMNTSFDPLRIVNTYGAFGSITKERTEVILQGTRDDPSDPQAKWEEYEFKCKPGSVTRRPCLISPFHYRLDWLMWFAAFQSYQHNNWLVHLAGKLLVNDEGVTSLIAHNPFENKDPPKWIRAEHYRYTFPKMSMRSQKVSAWWKRTKIGNYMPPVSLDSLKDYMKANGWEIPRLPAQTKQS